MQTITKRRRPGLVPAANEKEPETMCPFPACVEFLTGILAGVFVGSAMMEHAARKMDATAWISYNQAKDAVYGPVMPVFFGVTLVVVLVGAVLSGGQVEQVCAALSLFFAGVITGRIHLPLNKVFAGWSASAHPHGWSAPRHRWRAWNLVRTTFAIIAFALTIVGRFCA
ncbi:DUF1772 domain-containing protein [Rhizobium sp. 2MFCol3.1]|uniref:DUF1772 domain-containing protein n=1 Tax=Rhizobium sp. 2MFCol3.1 TaxID=1246459 RepID=UPI0012DD65CB|nr:DUF1772 domain-containing protein [Rhizobium sp. 2MFCol3.1]